MATKLASVAIYSLTALTPILVAVMLAAPAQAQQSAPKPNILVIMGDIESIASKGCLFTDWYAQQSCTAGRASLVARMSNSGGR